MVKKKEDHKKKVDHKKVDHKKDVHGKTQHYKKPSHDNSDKVRLWQIVSGILLVLLIIVALFAFSGNDENIVEEGEANLNNTDDVAYETMAYINNVIMQGQGSAQMQDIVDIGDLYLIKLNVNGQEFDSYVTKDGELFFPQGLNMSEEVEVVEEDESSGSVELEVAKSDKPVVEVFVMSHCPYGTQIEKGILPVALNLADKIDFEIKFVNYAMHPSYGEVEEQLNQYCIQRDYNDKFLIYLGKFLEEGSSEDAFAAAGLTEDDIASCVTETDEEFSIISNLENTSSWAGGRYPMFMIHDEENQKYGVQGSPALVINGETVSSARDAQSLQNVICAAFNEQPEECSVDMTQYGSPSAGFGFSQGDAASAASCG